MEYSKLIESRQIVIALVLDDEDFLQQASTVLSDAGYYVLAVLNPEALYKQLLREMADILVIGLTDLQYLDVVGYLYHLKSMPVITMGPDDSPELEMDALACGANRHIRKPWSAEKILSNINAMVRSMSLKIDMTASNVSHPPLISKTDVWQLDSRKWHLISPAGQRLQITFCEFSLLKLLMDAGGQPVSRDYLIKQLFPEMHDTKRRDIHMLIYRFRKKVKEAFNRQLPIKNSHTNGYVFTEQGRLINN